MPIMRYLDHRIEHTPMGGHAPLAYPAMKFAAKKILENNRAFEIERKIIPIKEIINLIKND